MYAATTQWAVAPRPAPDGSMLFAVGDVHGHASELQALQRVIGRAVLAMPDYGSTLVYVGDYVDRGPSIVETLDILIEDAAREDGVERVHLVGNHDQFLIEATRGDASLDRAFFTAWFDNGGEDTLRALGVEGYGRLLYARRFDEIATRVRAALGERRLAFLDTLQPMHRAGQYVFVHAGIDPAVDLDSQDFTDLLLIREPFLSAGAQWRHEFCVVHGHSIAMPTVLPHRVAVDAGCYAHGALCAVQIVGDQLRYHGVSLDADFDWQHTLGGRQGEWHWDSPLRVA